MGVVYLAEDTQLGRQVALKFIHGDRLKEKHAKIRLMREARAAAAIDHPNVAGVYEVSEVEGHPFIAMAYVKGIKLEERILEGLLEIAGGARHRPPTGRWLGGRAPAGCHPPRPESDQCHPG